MSTSKANEARINHIRSIFANSTVVGMDKLYAAINNCRMQIPTNTFQDAYNNVMELGGAEAKTWIAFTVQAAMIFDIENMPSEELFMKVLEEFCDRAG